MEKNIHYCWFGGGDIPAFLQNCISTWKKRMPDWNIIRWDESNFDINSTPWTKKAYEAKKYAFVSDYVRLIALYNMGGIYLDTDVELLKSLETFYDSYDAFAGFENYQYISSAILGAKKNHPLIKEFLSYYNETIFNSEIINSNIANVIMMTKICIKYGLKIDDSEQEIKIPMPNSLLCSSFHVFPRTFFCPLDFYHNKNFTNNTHTIHYFQASWLEKDKKKKIVMERKKIYKAFNNLKSILKNIYYKLR